MIWTTIAFLIGIPFQIEAWQAILTMPFHHEICFILIKASIIYVNEDSVNNDLELGRIMAQ